MNLIKMLVIFSVLASESVHAMLKDTQEPLLGSGVSSVSDIRKQQTTGASETGVATHNNEISEQNLIRNSVEVDLENQQTRSELKNEIIALEFAYNRFRDGIAETRAARSRSGCLDNGSCNTVWGFEGGYFKNQILPLYERIGESIQEYNKFLELIDNPNFTSNDEVSNQLEKVKSDNQAVTEAMNTFTFKNGPTAPWWHLHNSDSYSATASSTAISAAIAAGGHYFLGSGGEAAIPS